MKRKIARTTLLSSLLMMGAVAFTSCTDDDYDLDEVDATIGLGSDEISIPVSTTAELKLADILELDGTECVKVRENGDYVFEQKGGDVSPARPAIDVVTLAKREIIGFDIGVSFGAETRAGLAVNAEGDVQTFSYQGDLPDEVESLVSADVESVGNFVLNFPTELSDIVPTIDELSISLPDFMELTGIESSAPFVHYGSKIIFNDLSTATPLTVDFVISAINFDVAADGNNSLVAADGKIDMNGCLHLALSASIDNIVTQFPTSCRLSSRLVMGDFVIEGAEGYFSPSIQLDDLGSVTVDDIPDFLADGNVVVDLYNPQIMLSITSDMNIAGMVDGVITSVKDGVTLATVNVEDIPVNPNATTNICICRRASGVDASQYVIKEVDNLSNLIRTIPDRIYFTATAYADATQPGYFQLGHEYTVQPAYSVEAPIAFDSDAMIVYKDSVDGWNSDIQDFSLAEGAYVSVDMNMENRMPAYLNVEVTPIDVNGNSLAGQVDVVVSNGVEPSPDGSTVTTTVLNVKLTETQSGALKKLDGLRFTVSASATDEVVGITLNANNHTLKAKDIKVKLVGKVIGDLN